MVPRAGNPRSDVVEAPLALLYPLHPVPRAGMPPNHVEELVELILARGFDLNQAIPVARLPDGRLVQLGGHHRAQAMRLLGELTIPARVVDWVSILPAAQHKYRQAFPTFPWDERSP